MSGEGGEMETRSNGRLFLTAGTTRRDARRSCRAKVVLREGELGMTAGRGYGAWGGTLRYARTRA